jgi:hypothetical protein
MGAGKGEGVLREQKVKRDGKTIVKIKRQRSARGKGSAHVYFHQILGPDMSLDLGEIFKEETIALKTVVVKIFNGRYSRRKGGISNKSTLPYFTPGKNLLTTFKSLSLLLISPWIRQCSPHLITTKTIATAGQHSVKKKLVNNDF